MFVLNDVLLLSLVLKLYFTGMITPEYGMKMEASPTEYAASCLYAIIQLNSFSADNSIMEQCFHKLTHTFGRH